MIFFLGVIALVVLVHVLYPNRPVPSSSYLSGYYERPLEDILAERRTDAAIARYLATREAREERLRPTALAQNITDNTAYLRWPDDREEWVPWVELHAKNIKPRSPS